MEGYIPNNQAFLDTYIDRLGVQFICTLCQKVHNQKPHAQNHVESKHFPDKFVYTCKYCGDTFNGRNKYYVHMSKYHKYQDKP